MPPKKKEDMTPEEYEALKLKLADMRLKAVAKAQERREAVEKAKAEALAQHKPKRYVPVAERGVASGEALKQTETPPQPVVVPAQPVVVPAQSVVVPAQPVVNIPIPVPQATQPKVSSPSPPRVPEEEGFDLEKYFEAKYKAKSKYYPKKEQPIIQPPVEPKPVPLTTQQLLQQNASQQIRQRVNEDLLKMAMRNVFGDY